MPNSASGPVAAKGNFIDGKFRIPKHPDGVLERRNPAKLDDVTAVVPVSRAAVDEAVDAARAAQPAWAAVQLAERANAMRRIRAATVNRRDELAARISREVGKPLWEARDEVQSMLKKVDVTLDAGLREVADITPASVRGACRYRPVGVFAVIGPFNMPAYLVHGPVIAALVTGNTVVAKPSEVAPGVGQLYAEIVEEAHLPRGVFNLVQGDAAIGQALAAHARVDGVLFTGSCEGGRAVEATCAAHPRKVVVLSMGGKNAAIVLDDANLDIAVHECLAGAFITSGQRCTATSRIVVARKVADEFVRRFCDRARAIRVGDPFAPDVFMGPLATERGLAKFLDSVESARAEGAVPLVAGGRIVEAPHALLVAPSVHEVPLRRADSRYQRDELFGPDVAIYRVKNVDAAMEIANDTDFGLVASVFTADEARYREVGAHLRTGLVNWNRATTASSSFFPFGGHGRSGNGRVAGLHTIRSCVYPVASIEEPAGRPESYPGLGPPEQPTQ